MFLLEADDVGEMTMLKIGHDNSGLCAAWYLEEVGHHSAAINRVQ